MNLSLFYLLNNISSLNSHYSLIYLKLKIKNFEKSQYFKNYENIQDGIQYYFPKILRINPLCLMPPSKKLIVIRMLDKSFYSK